VQRDSVPWPAGASTWLQHSFNLGRTSQQSCRSSTSLAAWNLPGDAAHDGRCEKVVGDGGSRPCVVLLLTGRSPPPAASRGPTSSRCVQSRHHHHHRHHYHVLVLGPVRSRAEHQGSRGQNPARHTRHVPPVVLALKRLGALLVATTGDGSERVLTSLAVAGSTERRAGVVQRAGAGGLRPLRLGLQRSVTVTRSKGLNPPHDRVLSVATIDRTSNDLVPHTKAETDESSLSSRCVNRRPHGQREWTTTGCLASPRAPH
jgi:hypothetical protein